MIADEAEAIISEKCSRLNSPLNNHARWRVLFDRLPCISITCDNIPNDQSTFYLSLSGEIA